NNTHQRDTSLHDPSSSNLSSVKVAHSMWYTPHYWLARASWSPRPLWLAHTCWFSPKPWLAPDQWCSPGIWLAHAWWYSPCPWLPPHASLLDTPVPSPPCTLDAPLAHPLIPQPQTSIHPHSLLQSPHPCIMATAPHSTASPINQPPTQSHS